MKKLTKIKLIHWHYFINETLDIKGHTLITGENGSGKSTILDALQYVLTCGKQKFNQAANDKASRDLIGYVRCKTGRDSHQYERTGDITSHIALEFYDNEKKKPFVIGTVTDSSSNLSHPKSIFYRLEDVEIQDDLFLDNGIPRKISDFKIHIRDLTSKISKTQQEARNDFRNRFGALNMRFFDLLPKALAFRPINNVKDFVYSYLLDEKEVHIDLLKENIRTLSEFESYLKKIKEKITHLETIKETHQALLAVEENMKIQDYIVVRTNKELNLLSIKNQSNEKEGLQTSLQLKQNKQKDKTNELDRLVEYLSHLESTLQDNDHYRILKHLEKEEKELTTLIQELNIKNKQLDDKLKSLFDFILSMHHKDLHLDGMKDLYQYKKSNINEENIQLFLNTLTTFNDALKDYQNHLLEKKAKINVEVEGNLNELSLVENDIKRLESKQLIFPYYVTQLQEAINREMKKEHGLDVMPKVLCELLEVKDPKWQNAVEGYLNTQRFNLIVLPEYFDQSLRIYEQVKDRLNIHSIGLVNTQKLDQYEDENKDSLAYMVTSQNQYAKQYINLLLNKVIRAETVDDLKKHRRAITPSCMVYQNHTARAINPSIYKTPYIGLDAYKRQLELKHIEKEKLEEKIKSLKEKAQALTHLISLFNTVDLYYIKENCFVKPKLKKTEDRIKDIHQKIDEIDKTTFIEIQENIKSTKVKSEELKSQIEKLRDSIAYHKYNIQQLEKEIKNKEDNQIHLEHALTELEEKMLSILSKAEERYFNAVKDKDLKVVRDNYQRQQQGSTTRYYNVLKELELKQSNYNREHHFGASLGIEGMDDYYEEYKLLKDSQLVEYEEKIRQSKKKAEEQFQDEFVSKLQENILNAQREFKKLNEALKGITFGEDEYRFEYFSDKQNEKFYKMIMDDSNIGGESLFSTSFREKHKEALEELFEKISIDDDWSKKALETYTDYRMYMDYDIKIIHKNGTTSSFSKVCREKSGGETQTPYYVAIVASFLQLYQINPYHDAIGLILFDEAFDKMDENRIEAMMSFLSKLDIQIILASPPQKIETISPFVQSNLIVNRDDNIAFIEEFHYEKVS